MPGEGPAPAGIGVNPLVAGLPSASGRSGRDGPVTLARMPQADKRATVLIQRDVSVTGQALGGKERRLRPLGIEFDSPTGPIGLAHLDPVVP